MSPFRLIAVALLVGVASSASLAQQPQRLKKPTPARPVASIASPPQVPTKAEPAPLRPASQRVAEAAPKAAPATSKQVANVSYQHDVMMMSQETTYPYDDSMMMAGDEGACCGNTCAPCCGRWYAGFEATFLQPRFSNNPAYTLIDSDGASYSATSQIDFDSQMAFAPRVYAGVQFDSNLGFQATWWRFDNDPNSLTAQPPANGFGNVAPVSYLNVDTSTGIPGEMLFASSKLTAYTIDLELTKKLNCGCWNFGVAGGVRYAEINQSYFSQTTSVDGAISGQNDYQHGISGFGPTLSLFASAPLTQCWSIFSRGRGSLLFGNAHSNLTAGEDLDLSTPFMTTLATSRDDLLTIGDLQLGLQWNGSRCCGCWQPFATVAMEGQFWNGVGNASSEEGNVGFFGVVASAGLTF